MLIDDGLTGLRDAKNAGGIVGLTQTRLSADDKQKERKTGNQAVPNIVQQCCFSK